VDETERGTGMDIDMIYDTSETSNLAVMPGPAANTDSTPTGGPRHTLTPLSAMAWGGDMGLARRVATGQMMTPEGQWLAHYIPEWRDWAGYDPHRGVWTRADGRSLVSEALRRHGQALERERKAIEAQIATMTPGPDLTALTERRDHIERDETAARKASTVPKLEGLIRSEVGCTRPVNAAPFDAAPGLLCARNGAIDIVGERLMAHSPSHYFTGGVPVAYDPAADCPVFEGMLAQIMPDPDSREQLLRLLGSCLTGRGPQHLAIFQGDGSDGKSTLFRVMRALLGGMAAILEQGILCERQNDTAFGLAALEGARMAIADEIDDGAKLNGSRMRSLTGGSQISVANKGEKARVIPQTWTLILACNQLPKVQTYGNNNDRRILIWRFPTRFWKPSDSDFHLRPDGAPVVDEALETHVIEHELPGVLNLLVAAAGRYLRDDIIPSAEMADSKREHKGQTDTLGTFFSENCVYPAPGHSIANAELWARIREHCAESEQPVPNTQTVAPWLRRRHVEQKSKRVGGKPARLWLNIRWRTDADEQGVTVLHCYSDPIPGQKKRPLENIQNGMEALEHCNTVTLPPEGAPIPPGADVAATLAARATLAGILPG
jgi:P4 family phage/plasmid primase-like protien